MIFRPDKTEFLKDEIGLMDEVLNPKGFVAGYGEVWIVMENRRLPTDVTHCVDHLSRDVPGELLRIIDSSNKAAFLYTFGDLAILSPEYRDPDRGWYLFGFAPCYGFHSMILAVDYRNPSNPKFYFGDQDPGRTGGWKEYSTGELNAWVLKANQDWFFTPQFNINKPQRTTNHVWLLRKKPVNNTKRNDIEYR